jgi:polysaccharide biosynthesis/export protein
MVELNFRLRAGRWERIFADLKRTLVLALAVWSVMIALPSYAQQRKQDDVQQTSGTPASPQAEINSVNPSTQLRPDTIADTINRPEETDESSEIKIPEDATKPAEVGEFEDFVSKLADQKVRRFGASLLIPDGRGFKPTTATSVPADYRLTPGDELIIGLTGSIESPNLRTTIDRDGNIFIPKIGSIHVSGVRYAELPSVVSRQVARFYRGFEVSASVGKLRGITIYVTGFAQAPGAYTVSSFSTLVSAVFEAGGPSSGGSFRSIQLRRGSQVVSDFDLYDLLLKGDKSGDALLQNGDVIYIAPSGPQLAVIGSVNQQAIFEAGPQDTLKNILLYAGGVNTVADNKRLLVLDPLRTDTSGWEELSPEAVAIRAAKRGEVIRILSAVGLDYALSQQPVLITVSGEVEKPGRYYFQPGVKLSDALAKAGGLTADAYPFATIFTRQSVKQQQRINFERAISDAELAMTAQPLTSARRNELTQPNQLAMIQAVLKELRKRKPDGRIVLEISESNRDLPGQFRLENNDTLYIPPQPITVSVFGAVPSPASFKYENQSTIGSYLARAGGVQKVGDRSGIFVVRANGTVISRKGGKGSLLKAKALPGDLVFVPIDASRGEAWARITDIFQLVFSGALVASTISSLSR